MNHPQTERRAQYVVQPWTDGGPRTPTLTSQYSKTGAVTSGQYQVEVSYVLGTGVTVPSKPATITVGSDSAANTYTLTITSPPPVNGATGWYAYVMNSHNEFIRQQPAGSPTPIGSDLTLSHVMQGNGSADTADMPVAGCPDPTNSLSQGQIAAIVNPALNGWVALDGSEINDNGSCDTALTDSKSTSLAPEFNNGGVITNDPFAPICASGIQLAPTFVLPSRLDAGDVVKFDGSKSPSTLLVPAADYVWQFGDGTTAVGPSVVHSYAKPGSYKVTLTLTDRGGYVASSKPQTLTVSGPPPPPTPPPPRPPTPPPPMRRLFDVRLRLMPQGLRSVLQSGVAVQVTSNTAACGIVSLWIPRAAAVSARIADGGGSSVAVGRGTVGRIKVGTVMLHVRLSPTMAGKLGRLAHVTLTIRMALKAADGARVTVVDAGSY